MGVNDSPAAVDADDIAILFKNGNSLFSVSKHHEVNYL